MRIIGGTLGGRSFSSPPGRKTHPMSDKIRGALFNTLGDISGLTVLDAFAGSGALSFEAVSRGAAKTVAVEIDRTAQRTIRENIRKLDLEAQIKLINANVSSWLNTTSDSFDLVFCDPPYNDVKPLLLNQLAKRCGHGGIVVFSLPPQAKLKLASDYELLSGKNYGDAELSFYRRLGGVAR